jgi:glyoxylase-like metal-dependent hydrolase (beta-lactamase superfamily II)
VAGVNFLDLNFLGHPGVIGTGVMPTSDGFWLIDPGPSTALPGLRQGLAALGLSLADLRGLLLTHIHLDHAGATGTIVRRHPDVRVFVHERGAPHMVDPSRLLESAGRLYAGTLERLWGEVAPVPAANIQVLKGGESLDLAGRMVEVAYTPGHASHHVAYFDVATRVAFVGDTGGVRLAPAPHLMPPTPPPDIDLPAWSRSIARIREWNAGRLYLTHFGAVEQPGNHLDALEQQLSVVADLVRGILEEPGSDQERMNRFVERVTLQLQAAMPEDEVRRYQVAVPLEHCWLGLARYWRKKAAVPPA